MKSDTLNRTKLQHIVIVGAGFAGLRAAHRLSQQRWTNPPTITIIDRSPYHIYTPSLYEIVAGVHPNEAIIPIRDCLEGTGVEFIEGTVAAIHLKKQTIELTGGRELSYSDLILALGCVPNYYNIKGLKNYGYRFKTLDDAWVLRQHIEQEFESVAHHHLKGQPARAKLRFVIAGAGPTGIELTAELAEFRQRLAKLHHLPVSFSEIELIEAQPTILPGQDPRLIQFVERQLQRLGVILTTNTIVKEERPTKVLLKKGSRATETLIWTAGVAPHPILDTLKGIERDRRGFVVVDGQLRTTSNPHLWIVGDLASVPRSGTAPAALKQADHVATCLYRLSLDKPLPSYEPPIKAIVLPLGHQTAIAQIGSWIFSGLPAMALKRFIDLRYLVSLLPFAKAWKIWSTHHAPCPTCRNNLNRVVWPKEGMG